MTYASLMYVTSAPCELSPHSKVHEEKRFLRNSELEQAQNANIIYMACIFPHQNYTRFMFLQGKNGAI